MPDGGVRDTIDAPIFVAYARYDAAPAEEVEAEERGYYVEGGVGYCLEVEVRKSFK